MKCISKPIIGVVTTIMMLSVSICGCSSVPFSAKYSVEKSPVDNRENQYFPTFASEKCVVNEDISTESGFEINEKASGGLFDLNNKRTIYAKNVNLQVMPASLTKVMTAYVALKYGKLDQMLTADESVLIDESGAQKIGLEVGDEMTLDQALHLMLIYSANDVANLIASNIGGSIEGFAELMNKEAALLGATRSHFVNPNGLNADDHYVTAYDLYLIFDAAIQYDTFSEIINMTEYSTNYQNAAGESVEVTRKNTNGFLSGNATAPSGVTVIGGKTGTTQAAGHCLILLAKDKNGNPYIAVIMRDEDGDKLYSDMTSLLDEITK